VNAIEREIYYYLKNRRRESITVREIGRRLGSRRKFHRYPDWAKPVLLSMSDRGILETEDNEHYRLKPPPKKDTQGKRWTSPAIAKLLQASGKNFDGLLATDDDDEYYLNL
jgi:hypothetical protein